MLECVQHFIENEIVLYEVPGCFGFMILSRRQSTEVALAYFWFYCTSQKMSVCVWNYSVYFLFNWRCPFFSRCILLKHFKLGGLSLAWLKLGARNTKCHKLQRSKRRTSQTAFWQWKWKPASALRQTKIPLANKFYGKSFQFDEALLFLIALVHLPLFSNVEASYYRLSEFFF